MSLLRKIKRIFRIKDESEIMYEMLSMVANRHGLSDAGFGVSCVNNHIMGVRIKKYSAYIGENNKYSWSSPDMKQTISFIDGIIKSEQEKKKREEENILSIIDKNGVFYRKTYDEGAILNRLIDEGSIVYSEEKSTKLAAYVRIK